MTQKAKIRGKRKGRVHPAESPVGYVYNPKRDPPDKEALLSECGTYRYWLLRQWDWDLRAVAFVMLNPSTADADQDDNTIRKCVQFARRWGAGGIEVVNLFSFRSRDPKKLVTAADPVGPETDQAIREVAEQCHPVVLGWGNSVPRACRGRVAEVLTLIRRAGQVPKCLAVTGEGQPQHPLFVKYATPLTLYTEG